MRRGRRLLKILNELERLMSTATHPGKEEPLQGGQGRRRRPGRPMGRQGHAQPHRAAGVAMASQRGVDAAGLGQKVDAAAVNYYK